jgi:hypothetical protein
MTLKLKKLTVFHNGQAAEFKNRNVKDGTPVPINYFEDQQRAFIEFSINDVMVVNLDQCQMFRYVLEDGDVIDVTPEIHEIISVTDVS